MTVTAQALTSGSDASDLSSYTIPSVSPSPNTLVVLVLAYEDATAAAAPTSVTGCGVSWEHVVSRVTFAGNNGVAIFVGRGPAVSGSLTVTFDSTQGYLAWSIVQFPGGRKTTNAFGAVGVATTQIQTTFNAFFQSSNSAGLIGVWHFTHEGASALFGYTELHDFTIDADDALMTAWKILDQDDVGASWATLSDAIIVGVEVAEDTNPVGLPIF